MSNGTPTQRNPLIQAAAPLITLGGICYVTLGFRPLGISLLSIGALIVVLHVVGRFVRSLKSALEFSAYAISSLVAKFPADAIDTFKGISGFLGRLVFVIVVVSFLVGLVGLLGKVAANYWGNERLALDYLRTADTCLTRDDYRCAGEEVQRAEALLPNDIRVLEASIRTRLLRLAVRAVLQDAVVTEEVRQAKAECEFWSNRSPRDPSLVALLGVADSLLDDPYAAEVQYKKATDLNPSYANAYNYWGFDLMRWRLHPNWSESAKEKLVKAASLDPKYPMPLINLGWLVLDTEPSDDRTFKQVEGYLLKTRDASPEDQRVYASLGGLYLEWGKLLESRKVPEEAARKYVAAHDYLSRGYKLNPKNPFLLLRLAEVLSLLHAEPGRVIQYLKDATYEAPDYSDAFWYLAQAYGRAGKKVEARQAFDAARKLLGQTITDLEQRRNRLPDGEVRNRLDSWLADERDKLAKLGEVQLQLTGTTSQPNR